MTAPATPRVLRLDFRGRSLEIVLHGDAREGVVRIVDRALEPVDGFSDSYIPPSALGFLWVRDTGHHHLITGLISETVASTAEDLDRLVELIEDGFGVDEGSHRKLDAVISRASYANSGEENLYWTAP